MNQHLTVSQHTHTTPVHNYNQSAFELSDHIPREAWHIQYTAADLRRTENHDGPDRQNIDEMFNPSL